MLPASLRDALVDDALQRVAVIHQQHSVKGCLAVLRLLERFPTWGTEVVPELASVREEEPIAPDFGARLEVSGRSWADGEPRRLLEKALYPTAYGAMRAWVQAESLDAVLEHYREMACAEPDYLGHNVSIYCSLLGMRSYVEEDPIRMGRFLDRLTEFVTATFHCRQNRIVFPTEPHADGPATADAVLDGAFRQPGFFGHQILAFVWSRRYRSALGTDGYSRVLRHLQEMSHWRIPEKNRFSVAPAEGACSEPAFEEAIRHLAFRGPRNIHRLTLSDALVDVWDSTGDERTRRLALGAARHFTRSPRAL